MEHGQARPFKGSTPFPVKGDYRKKDSRTMKMTEREQAKVLNALYSYKTFKKIARDEAQRARGIYIKNENGELEYMGGEQIDRAVLLSEEVRKHFNRVDEYKGKFVELYFFRRVGALSVICTLPISRSTVFEWRRDVIEIAEKIAREIAFI